MKTQSELDMEDKIKSLEETIKELQLKLAETEATLEEKEHSMSMLKADLDSLLDIGEEGSGDRKIDSPKEMKKIIKIQDIDIRNYIKCINSHSKEIAVLLSRAKEAEGLKMSHELTIKRLHADNESKDKTLAELKKVVDGLRQEIEQVKASSAKKLNDKQKRIERMLKEKKKKMITSGSERVLAVYTHDEPNGDTELLDELDRTQTLAVTFQRELDRAVKERTEVTEMLETKLLHVKGKLLQQKDRKEQLKNGLIQMIQERYVLERRLSEAENCNASQKMLQKDIEAENAKLVAELSEKKQIQEAFQQDLDGKITTAKELELKVERLKTENRVLTADNDELDQNAVTYKKELDDLKEEVSRIEKDLDNRVFEISHIVLKENETTFEGKVTKVGQLLMKTRKALKKIVRVHKNLKAEMVSTKQKLTCLEDENKELSTRLKDWKAKKGSDALSSEKGGEILASSPSSGKTSVGNGLVVQSSLEECKVMEGRDKKLKSNKTKEGSKVQENSISNCEDRNLHWLCKHSEFETASADSCVIKEVPTHSYNNNIRDTSTANENLKAENKSLLHENVRLTKDIYTLRQENSRLVKKYYEQDGGVHSQEILVSERKVREHEDKDRNLEVSDQRLNTEIRNLRDENQTLRTQIADLNSRYKVSFKAGSFNDNTTNSIKAPEIFDEELNKLRENLTQLQNENTSILQTLKEKELVIRNQEICIKDAEKENKELKDKCGTFQTRASCLEYRNTDLLEENSRLGRDYSRTEKGYSFATNDLQDPGCSITSQLGSGKENKQSRERRDYLKRDIQVMNESKDLTENEIIKNCEKKVNYASVGVKDIVELNREYANQRDVLLQPQEKTVCERDGNYLQLMRDNESQKHEILALQKQVWHLCVVRDNLEKQVKHEVGKSQNRNTGDMFNDTIWTKREECLVEDLGKDQVVREKTNSESSDAQFYHKEVASQALEQQNVICSLRNQLRNLTSRNLELQLRVNELKSSGDATIQRYTFPKRHEHSESKASRDGPSNDVMDGMDARLARIEGRLLATQENLDKIHEAKKIYHSHRELFYRMDISGEIGSAFRHTGVNMP